MKYEKGKIYKILGYVTKKGVWKRSGDYQIVECEESHEMIIGTILFATKGYKAENQAGAAIEVNATKGYLFAESRQEYLEKHPDLLPVKEIVKEVIKEKDIEVPVKIYEWNDTLWDKLYNWYCKRKGRSNSEFV